MIQLSIVSTLYKSENFLNEFYERLTLVCKKLKLKDYEIIFVNDGSDDSSLDIAIKLMERDSKLKIIDLSRNFGHHKAIITGLKYAQGEDVFLIDSDLEEQPEWLLEFYNFRNNNNCDVVYGVQEKRTRGFLDLFFGNLFYYLFNFITDLNLPKNLVIARLMTKRYVSSFVLHCEREVSIAGLFLITGYKQLPFIVKKQYKKTTTYTFSKKIELFINSITSFSDRPLVFIFYIGMIISVISFGYILYLILMKLLFMKPLMGWTSIMASIWFIGGIIISFIGIIGIYIAKIFSETKQRPNTIVRKIYSKNN